MNRFYLIFLLLSSPIFFILSDEIKSPQPKETQELDSVDSIQLLNSSEKSVWYATESEIDPEKFSGKLNSDWEAYSVPGVFSSKKNPKKNYKTLWILKKFTIQNEWKSGQIAIRLGVISDRDQAYLNGKLIGKNGDFNASTPQAYDKIRIYKIPDNLLRAQKENILLVKIGSYFPEEIGLTQDFTSIGPSDLIEKDFYHTEYFKLILLMIYFTAGGYFLFLFIRRRKEYENLFFGLFTFALVVYQFLRNQIKYDLNFEFYTLKKIEYMVLPLLIPIFYHFIRTLFKYPYHIIAKLTDAVQISIFLFFLFTSDIKIYNVVNANLVQPLWLVSLVFAFFYLIKKIIKKDRDAIYILSGMIVMLGATLLDVLSTRQIIVLPRMTGYAFIFFILSLATILANKFVRLNEEVEELNVTLEGKVEERTRELNQTLGEVQALKVQQDGDYFLTSLLLNPLTTNKNQSELVETAFYVKQKKSFEFKNKTHEIGGDICITSNIELSGKNYTVFANGDAMGKSIQGAGGALVMGVVFNAVLTRSKLKIQKNKTPELWLKEAFLDLQNVFESFNGSMYLSIVMGLVDNTTGFMYFINAEHPWTVLYRDEKASFIENELVLRKIGTPDNTEALYIKTFQLLPGDVIFVGSDGRDDIQLGTDSNGSRIINEDESLFLKRVEEGQGKLKDTVDKIFLSGGLTDDFTLLRLSFKENSNETQAILSHEFLNLLETGKESIKSGNVQSGLSKLEEAYSIHPDNEEILKLLSTLYYKTKNYEKASKFFDEFLQIKPESTEAYLYASFAHKMNRNFNKAADYGELLLLRDPNMVKNLINLADVYKNLNVIPRAKELIEKALKFEPENSKGLQVQKSLAQISQF